MTEQKLKKQRVVVRLDDDEKNHLTRLAEENGLSLSEYIRISMLEERHLSKVSKYKRDMTVFTVFGYYLLGRLAKKDLTEAEINESYKRTMTFLKEHGMQEE